MPQRSGDVHHVPVVGRPPQPGEDRVHIILDASGRKIGASPHITVEQVDVRTYRGTITTTLKIRPRKAK